MTSRPDTGNGPLETAAIWLFLTAVAAIGLVWGSGILVGSILGSGLPAGSDGVAAILQAFPHVGRAWTPPIPTALVWVATVGVVVALYPVGRMVVRAFRPARRGAEWADSLALRRAGLLVPARTVPHSVLEPEDLEIFDDTAG